MSNPMSRIAQAGLDGAGQLIHQLQRRLGSDGNGAADPEPRSRWRSVTINKSPEEVMPDGRVPDPLAALGDHVEVKVRKAAGDKGTELAARLRQPEPSGLGSVGKRMSGDDPRQQVRAALRAPCGVGSIRNTSPTSMSCLAWRSAAPTGKLVDLATRRAGGEGVL